MKKDDGQFVARVRVDKSRLIATPFVVEDTLYAYSAAGTLSAYKTAGVIERSAETEAVAEETPSEDAVAPETEATATQDGTDEPPATGAVSEEQSSTGKAASADTSEEAQDPERRSGPRPSLRSSEWLFP
jgi:hypothetical protein